MMKINMAVCDDDAKYAGVVENYIYKLGHKIQCDVYANGEDLLKSYKNNSADYDVIFLDMELGGINGIETANEVRKTDDKVIIVFITSYREYMQQSFECAPFRFLLKPVDFDEFKKVYDDICIKLNDNPETFVFLENKKRTRLFCSDIVCFESDGHSILMHTKDGNTHKMRKTMTQLFDLVDSNMFVRTHRAYAVNLQYVYQIGDAEAILHNYHKAIPISRTYRKDLTDAFLNYKERKYVL